MAGPKEIKYFSVLRTSIMEDSRQCKDSRILNLNNFLPRRHVNLNR